MKLTVAIILLCLAASTYAAPRIAGGHDALAGKYPYQVSLRDPSSHFCGGSIVNERWILTAAHCVVGFSNNAVNVVVGTNLLNGTGGVVYKSDYITWHEDFNGDSFVNDIALIRVDRDIELNDKVQPIDLPFKDCTKANYSAVLTGWGRPSPTGPNPNNLQEIKLNVIDQKSCIEKNKTNMKILKSHICTLSKAGKGACKGDSGGPLVSDGVQIGIVSFGLPCARGVPDVFTRVYSFVDWIDEKMAKFCHCY